MAPIHNFKFSIKRNYFNFEDIDFSNNIVAAREKKE